MKQAPPKNIDEYIARQTEEVQVILEKLRAAIKQAAPDVQEAISYNMPAFKLAGNLVYFEAFKNHLNFYPEPSAIKHFKTELTAYECGKRSIKFPYDQPIDYRLIDKIVKFRVKENVDKAASKSK
ncbi:MAG: DUF1801 domain-containing protein [Anaerolineales bacterium]|nr:DUF1801 domain-containing protein [Anaerolineales bacterium]